MPSKYERAPQTERMPWKPIPGEPINEEVIPPTPKTRRSSEMRQSVVAHLEPDVVAESAPDTLREIPRGFGVPISQEEYDRAYQSEVDRIKNADARMQRRRDLQEGRATLRSGEMPFFNPFAKPPYPSEPPAVEDMPLPENQSLRLARASRLEEWNRQKALAEAEGREFTEKAPPSFIRQEDPILFTDPEVIKSNKPDGNKAA